MVVLVLKGSDSSISLHFQKMAFPVQRKPQLLIIKSVSFGGKPAFVQLNGIDSQQALRAQVECRQHRFCRIRRSRIPAHTSFTFFQLPLIEVGIRNSFSFLPLYNQSIGIELQGSLHTEYLPVRIAGSAHIARRVEGVCPYHPGSANKDSCALHALQAVGCRALRSISHLDGDKVFTEALVPLRLLILIASGKGGARVIWIREGIRRGTNRQLSLDGSSRMMLRMSCRSCMMSMVLTEPEPLTSAAMIL